MKRLRSGLGEVGGWLDFPAGALLVGGFVKWGGPLEEVI
jgi:hypothetical protein